MRSALLVLPVFLASACANHLSYAGDSLARRNRIALAGLQPGMSRADVLEAMDPRGARIREGRSSRPFIVPNPHHATLLRGVPGGRAELLYYYTDVALDDGLVSADELTPVMLRGGAFVAQGWDELEREAGAEGVRAARDAETEREIEEARARQAGPSWDPAEQEFRDAVGQGSYLIKLGTALQGFGF